MKKIFKKSIITTLIIGAVFAANYCLAATSIVDTSNPGYSQGNYTLNNVRDYAVYIMQLILGLVGTLSLIMFVYGGVTFLLSAGNQNNVKKGMEIIKAAVIGLILVFSSVLIIKVFFGGLFGTSSEKNNSGYIWKEETGAIEKK